MGSSFTEFRGKGFWSRDALLEAWFRVLSLHMDDDAHKPGWQHDLRDQWLLVSVGFFNGCISTSLDDFLTDGDRFAMLLLGELTTDASTSPVLPETKRSAIG